MTQSIPKRKRILSILAILALVLSLLPLTLSFTASADAKSIDIDNMSAGVVGAATANTKMIECGHEFSFDLLINAKFNEHVLSTVTKNPYDVVLVFDRSGSMADTRYGGSSTKWAAAKAAAKKIIEVINDYNKGTGLYAGTGTSDSRFGLVTYSSGTTSMKSSTTGSGNSTRFNVSSGTGNLIDPAGTTSSTSNKTLAERAIDNLSSSGTTNIADGIKDAMAMLDARTGNDALRPAYIIVMSDGVANQPYSHSGSTHNSTSIAGTQINTFLGSTLGVSLTGSHQCSPTEPTTHTCSTAGAILRGTEARNKGYGVYSVGFDLTGIGNTNTRNVAAETLIMIAGNAKGTSAGDAERYYSPGLSADELANNFKDIVDNQITVQVNPVAVSSILQYNAPAGFTVKSVQLSNTFTGAQPAVVMGANSKSFTVNIGDVYAVKHTVKVTLVADEDLQPGDYTLIGAGSTYSFTNVELNDIVDPPPAWYIGSGRSFSIDLNEWANDKTVTVLPLAKNTNAAVLAAINESTTVFTVAMGALNDAPFPSGGALSGSGDVFAANGTTKIGTFATTTAGIVITLDDAYAVQPGNSRTAKLKYTYTADGRTSCPKDLTVTLSVPTEVPDKITLIKTVSGNYSDGFSIDRTFNFTVAYNPAPSPALPTSYSLTTSGGSAQSADADGIVVPADYTGVVEVKETAGEEIVGGGKWTYDASTYWFTYTLGELVKVEKTVSGERGEITKQSVASFANSVLEIVNSTPITVNKHMAGDTYNGTFTFNVGYAPAVTGADYPATVDITTASGTGSQTVKVPDNYTGTVTISEVNGGTTADITAPVGKLTYSGDTYSFVYVNGTLTESYRNASKHGVTTSAADFTNSFLKTVEVDDVVINKTVTGDKIVETFSYNVTFSNYTAGNGAEHTITVNGTDFTGSDAVQIPNNYTGTVTIRENMPAGTANNKLEVAAGVWTYDAREYVFTFENGTLTGKTVDGTAASLDSTAAFSNDFFQKVPVDDLYVKKTATGNSAMPDGATEAVTVKATFAPAEGASWTGSYTFDITNAFTSQSQKVTVPDNFTGTITFAEDGAGSVYERTHGFWKYDSAATVLTYVNGTLTDSSGGSFENGTVKTVSFINAYEQKVQPAKVPVTKTINNANGTDAGSGTFSFTAVFSGTVQFGAAYANTVSFDISIAAPAVNGSRDVDVPANFTGTLTITETVCPADSAGGKWVKDTAVFVLTYSNGVLESTVKYVGESDAPAASVSFVNTYSKTVESDSVPIVKVTKDYYDRPATGNFMFNVAVSGTVPFGTAYTDAFTETINVSSTGDAAGTGQTLVDDLPDNFSGTVVITEQADTVTGANGTWTYDDSTYTVTFVNGAITGITKGSVPADSVEFTNRFLETVITGGLKIVKHSKETYYGTPVDAEFGFTVTYTPAVGSVTSQVYSFTTTSGYGERTVPVDDNYTGTVAIAETSAPASSAAATWDNDTSVYTFTYVNGVLTAVSRDDGGETDDLALTVTSATFNNFCLETVTPAAIVIEKTAQDYYGSAKDGTFQFTVAFNPGDSTTESITTTNGTGTKSITVPANYSGTVTITETADTIEATDGIWAYDGSSYVFTYENGVLVKVNDATSELSSTAAFTNVFRADVTPSDIVINKYITGDQRDGTFDFLVTVTDDAANTSSYTVIETEDFSGSAKLSVDKNFTGTVTISEKQGSPVATDGIWTYDESEYVFTYEYGALVGVMKDGEEVETAPQADFTNDFFQIVTPVDAMIYKHVAGDAKDGTFEFDVTFAPGETSTVSILTNSGIGSAPIAIPDNYTGTVTITEKGGVTADDGVWDCDTSTWVFEYDNGYLVRVNEQTEGELVGEASFTNTFRADVTPTDIIIRKDIDGGSNGTFDFTVVVQPVDGDASTITKTINTSNYTGSALVALDKNFSGTVTVSEVEGETENEDGTWIYDEAVYVLTYEAGVLVSVTKDEAAYEGDELVFVNEFEETIPTDTPPLDPPTTEPADPTDPTDPTDPEDPEETIPTEAPPLDGPVTGIATPLVMLAVLALGAGTIVLVAARKKKEQEEK